MHTNVRLHTFHAAAVIHPITTVLVKHTAGYVHCSYKYSREQIYQSLRERHITKPLIYYHLSFPPLSALASTTAELTPFQLR